MEENQNVVESQTLSETAKTETGSENTSTIKEEETVTPAITDEVVTDVTNEKIAEGTPSVTVASAKPLPIRNIPTAHQSVDDAIEMTYAEAAKLDNPKFGVVFETIVAAGRGGGPKFVPNTDVNRVIKTYLPKKNVSVFLPIGRNSKNESEGGIIGSSPIEFGFGFRFFSSKHKTQATLILVDGSELVGYVIKGEAKGGRRGFYFPKNVAEKVITLPVHGEQTKLEVSKLLIG